MVHALTEDLHVVSTAHLAETGIRLLEADIEPQQVYARDVAWLRDCDVVIAEVSVPSHGVGYEIGFSLGLGKPVLALYQAGRQVSKMISGNPDASLSVKSYTTAEEAITEIRNFLNKHKLCL
jgi:nucleoside 2-deoxyribosyltransferase